MLRITTLLAFGLSAGCTGSSPEEKPSDEDPVGPVDTDGDGLNDEEEAELGSDPAVADSDADGLGDLEERDLGTNPTAVDSDGDTYLDGDEVAEGHSPTDPEDRIYVGNWPYNAAKDAIVDPGFSVLAEEGGILPRFAWLDQYGQEVDIYDFAGQGKMTVVDLSGQWCYWCHELADWLEEIPSDYDGIYDDFIPIREAVASGELQWITIIDATVTGDAATEETIGVWWGVHPNAKIPVLLDSNFEFVPWISHGEAWFYPSYVVVDENMNLLMVPTSSNAGGNIFPDLTEMLEAQ